MDDSGDGEYGISWILCIFLYFVRESFVDECAWQLGKKKERRQAQMAMELQIIIL
jgi:hypothetical protein